MTITDRRGAVVSAAGAASALSVNAGLAFKTAVKCATTEPIVLSGLQTIDGVQTAAGDRVLVKDQADGTENLIYNVSADAWSRAKDTDSSPEMTAGVQVLVLNGTVNRWKTFVCTTEPPITVGTTAITWTALPVPNAAIPIIIDGGGTTIVTGDRVFVEVPFDCVIQRWTIVSSAPGSIQIDVLRETYAAFPGGVSICGASLPAISGGVKNQSDDLTGWTTSLLKGDILTGRVMSVSAIALCTLSLLVAR